MSDEIEREQFVRGVLEQLETGEGETGQVELGRSERDAIALALGRLAAERPGWYEYFLRPLAAKLDVLHFFEEARRWRKEELPSK